MFYSNRHKICHVSDTITHIVAHPTTATLSVKQLHDSSLISHS